MTRKDYVAIARCVQDNAIAFKGKFSEQAGSDALAVRLADMLAADNARFDRARFLKACGVQS